jgi:hypothetical protein
VAYFQQSFSFTYADTQAVTNRFHRASDDDSEGDN